eukprot:15036414-Alexandrium_andersonii.AAC.1
MQYPQPVMCFKCYSIYKHSAACLLRTILLHFAQGKYGVPTVLQVFAEAPSGIVVCDDEVAVRFH